MDSFPCQTIGRQQSTRRFNTRSSSTASVSKKIAKPEFYGVYTDTPIPSKRGFSSLLTPPRTPTRLPSIPECPGAPSRKRVSRVSQLKRRQSKTDEDILLDRKAIEIKKRMAILVGVRRQYVNATPDHDMPLRQSWGPLELAEIDSKLLAFLHASDDEDTEM